MLKVKGWFTLAKPITKVVVIIKVHSHLVLGMQVLSPLTPC
jgi:hypothetical protein